MGPCLTQSQLSPCPYPHPPSLLTVLQVSADINIIYILNLQLKLNLFPPIPAQTVALLFNTLSKDGQFGLSRESLALGRKGLIGPI